MARYILAFFTIMVCGCASLPGKRSVERNMLISDYPSVSITVSDDMYYLGNTAFGIDGKSVGGDSLYMSKDVYCFVKPDGNTVKSAMAIEFYRVQGIWRSNLHEGVKAVKKGTTKLGNFDYKYYVQHVIPSAERYITGFIHKKGFSMSPGLVKEYARICGANGNVIIKIMYYEPFSEQNNKIWNGVNRLDDDQVAFLNAFERRASLSFNVLK